MFNIGGLINSIVALSTGSTFLDFNIILKSTPFSFFKELAYTSHMFTIGLIFAIVAPVTNVIVFVIYVTFVAI